MTGIILQIIFGIITIRWEPGKDILECIANNIVGFLNYGEVGAQFVYGDFLIGNKVFAFQVSKKINNYVTEPIKNGMSNYQCRASSLVL